MDETLRELLGPYAEQIDPKLGQALNAMPKAEIHVHLEGAIQPETLLKLAQRHDMLHSLPADNVEGLRRWFVFRDFRHFIEIYFVISDLIRTPDDLALVVHDNGADMARQGIRYRELTFTPYSHTDLMDKGLSIDDLLAGLETGRQQARGEYGVEMRWVFDVPRNASFPRGKEDFSGDGYSPRPAEKTLEYALAGMDRGVIGFGLGGLEVGAPPSPYAHAFAEAKRAGLLSVPHAGETMGAESVRGAVDALGADRIGHGVRAMEDANLLARLVEEQIPLEVNPSSNICLHVYRRLAEHPIAHLDRMGALVTVNSDDPPLFNTSLVQEYAAMAVEFGYGLEDIARLARNAVAVCGAGEGVKAQMLAEFDAWGA